MQTAYEIRTAENLADLQSGKKLLWQTGKVESDQSIHIVYGGPSLKSRQRVYWQVRIWDNHGNHSEWSEPAFWEMGLLAADEWQANWIQPNLQEDPKISNPAPMLRKEFSLNNNIKSARLYITALGLYEAELNGKRVGDQYLTPGWTSYDHRLQYQTYDVTSLVQNGVNAMGVTLGDGWYRGNLTWHSNRNFYGDKLCLAGSA